MNNVTVSKQNIEVQTARNYPNHNQTMPYSEGLCLLNRFLILNAFYLVDL